MSAANYMEPPLHEAGDINTIDGPINSTAICSNVEKNENCRDHTLILIHITINILHYFNVIYLVAISIYLVG